MLLKVAVALALSWGGWPDPTVTDPAAQRRAEELARGFQGSWLVAKDGKVLAAGGTGKANRTSGEANGLRTKFRLASITQPSFYRRGSGKP